MSDIFISYASEDRELAKMLAHVLEKQGWSVWWDRKIPFGKNYDEVIAENLAAARCVIVLWTHHSVKSRWVRTEASEAADRNALIPILMTAEIKIPLQFKLLQTANLFGWKPGDVAHPEFERLLAHINELLATPQPVVQPEPNWPGNPTTIPVMVVPDSGEKHHPRKKALLILGIIISFSVLVGSVTYAMMNWRIPTRIQADLIVDRVMLTFGGTTVIPRIDFASATFERFSQLSFSPKKLEAIATTPSKSKNDHTNLIESLQDNDQVILFGNNRKSMITIENLVEENKQIGSLESIDVKPSTDVIFETSNSSRHFFTLRIMGTGLELAPNILPIGPFKLTAENVFTKNSSPVKLNKNPYFDLQVELGDANPFVKLESEPNDFIVTLALANNPSDESLIKRGSSVNKIEFLKQGRSGEFESTLIQPGTITYIDFTNIAPVIVDPHHFLGLDDLNDATIQELRFEPQQNGFVLRLIGEASKIVSRSGELTKDHRLTLFDKLWHDQKLAIIFSIVLWVGSVILGAYKMYQEVKKYA